MNLDDSERVVGNPYLSGLWKGCPSSSQNPKPATPVRALSPSDDTNGRNSETHDYPASLGVIIATCVGRSRNRKRGDLTQRGHFMCRLKALGLTGILTLLMIAPTFATEKSDATQLIALAKSNSPGLRDAITATLDTKELKDGTAWIARGPDFFFATEAPTKPDLFIDGRPG